MSRDRVGGQCVCPADPCTTVLRTKKIKGLHENDFILAAKVDRLAGQAAPRADQALPPSA